MCGIFGFVGFNNKKRISFETLKNATNLLHHRGPDDSGCLLIDPQKNLFLSEEVKKSDLIPFPIGMGHRRLSILDLSSRGRQPFLDKESQTSLVYNGEIYNYIELRKELESFGYRFYSDTDTEVVLKSYLKWGINCFERFNGMWALAIYDGKKKEVILSRDRFGKKPLFYTKDPSRLIFSSEIKSIVYVKDQKFSPNWRKLINYAARNYRYVDIDEESYFQEIFCVPKGSYSRIDLSGNMSQKSFWKITSKIKPNQKENKVKEEFLALFEDAVRLRLRSDVPVGFMLSGGLDSSSIACVASKMSDKLVAFSGVTGDGHYDESSYIKTILKKINIRSEFIYPESKPLIQTLQEMIGYHDEPVCTVTWYNLYIMTKIIADHGIKVILTGHGGDELFGGYWHHYHYNFADIRSQGQSDEIERRMWLENHQRDPLEYDRKKKFIMDTDKDPNTEILSYSSYVDALLPEVNSYDKLPSFSNNFPNYLYRRLYLELLHETVPSSVRAEDRNSMAFSIENRLPFLDYRLVDFAFGLENHFKIRNGLGKWIIREGMKGILPEEVRTRKDKHGFVAPSDKWFRNDLKKDIENMIESRSFANQQIYDMRKVKEYFGRHQEGENHAMFFWQFINLNIWGDMYFSST